MEQTLLTGARIAPAHVVRVERDLVLVERDEFRAWAAMALAYRYEPEVGDLLLVAGQEDCYYVIGVIAGKGRVVFSAPGDLELRAPRGNINLAAGGDVRVHGGKRVRIDTPRLEMVAKAVTQRFVRVHRWIRETLHTRAGRVVNRVAGTYQVKADRIVERATDDVKIDGRKIRLG
ncbi:MAG: DUF3540 domain-containing protein [Planctomycetota bacterium]|jgi:hypothetical protein